MINLLKKKIKDLLKVIYLDENEKFFIKKNKLNIKRFDKKKKNIFIEIDEEYYYLIYYKNLIKSGKLNKFNIIGIWTRTQHTLKKSKFLEPLIIIYYFIFNFFEKRKFYRLYYSIGVSKFLDLDDLSFSFFSKEKINLNKKVDIYKIKYKKINVGDLIYDTYLRYRSFPTMRIKDYYLNSVYSKISKIYNNLEIFKSKYKPKFYFANSSAYVAHGFPYRYFLKKKIPVVCGRTANSFNRLMSMNNFQSFYNFENYKLNFKKLKKKNEKINQSKINLSNRFLGRNFFQKDAQYMQVDPYSKNTKFYFPKKKFKQKKIKGVLFLQDFFDAPAAWGQNVFEDYYKWTLYTLMIIRKYKLPIAIKPHPNASYFYTDTVKYTNKLKKKYSDLFWLHPKTSNKIIFSNINFGISATGSILFELAYHKIKSISCGRHPAEKFNFSINAKDKNEYKNLLINSNKIKKTKYLIKDLHIFNYMHYLNDENLFDLEIKFNEFKKINFLKSSCLKKK